MKTGLFHFIAFVVFSLLLIACNTQEERPLVDPSKVADSLAALELAPAPPTPPSNPVPATPEPPSASNPSTSSTPSTPSTPSTSLALNPQHGQPGHRCDIAVGAPLPNTSVNNSTSASANTSSTVPVPASTQTANSIFNSKPNPQIQPKTVAPNTTTSLVKLNPKHGEPGHRCDIQVGAPLN